MNDMLAVPVTLMQDVQNYLHGRPYSEVAGLLRQFESGFPAIQTGFTRGLDRQPAPDLPGGAAAGSDGAQIKTPPPPACDGSPPPVPGEH